MIFDRNKYGESQTIEALVPMVDLFAVLAIVFMIYATEEIIVTKMESEKRIQAIEEKVENDRRSVLAREADETLEEIKKNRKKKAEELVLAFSEMLEAQQNQAAGEYEDLVANFENKHEEALAKELSSLDEQKRVLEQKRDELIADVEIEKSQLKKEQEKAVEEVRQASVQALAEQQSELVEEKVEALAEQEATLAAQKAEEIRKAEAEHARQLAVAESKLEADKRQALAKAAQAEKTH